ncbi:MAG: hypothetical protein ACREPA_06485 [Candidatus Dormibacteraceae bacterium]
MSAAGFVALGCLAFGSGFGLQYGGWRRLLKPGLLSGDHTARRQALRRWALFVVAFEVALLALVVIYMVVVKSLHPAGYAWAALPVGALLGSTVPLQSAAIAITRAGL